MRTQDCSANSQTALWFFGGCRYLWEGRQSRCPFGWPWDSGGRKVLGFLSANSLQRNYFKPKCHGHFHSKHSCLATEFLCFASTTEQLCSLFLWWGMAQHRLGAVCPWASAVLPTWTCRVGDTCVQARLGGGMVLPSACQNQTHSYVKKEGDRPLHDYGWKTRVYEVSEAALPQWSGATTYCNTLRKAKVALLETKPSKADSWSFPNDLSIERL